MTHKKFIELFNLFLFIILLLTAVFFAFYKLGDTSLHDWDEGRYARLAYEFVKSPTLIPVADGEPYLKKPPMGFWLEAVGFKLFGINNFGLRAPGSFFFVGSALILFFLIRKFYSALNAFWATLFFIVSPLLYTAHMIRTGDLDQFFIFFSLAAVYSYVTSWYNIKYFWISGLFLGLAFMSRGATAILYLLIIILHIIFDKKYKNIPLRQFVLGSTIFILLAVPWHIYALIKYPEQMIGRYWKYELLSRILQTIEGHTGNWLYYSDFFFRQLSYFFVLILVAVIILFYRVYKYRRTEDKLWLIWILVFVVSIQICRTKLYWYSFSLIPVSYIVLVPLAITIANYFKKQNFKSYLYGAGIFFIGSIFILHSLGAWFYISTPNILSVDSVREFLLKKKVSGENLLFYKAIKFTWPAKDFQWRILDNFKINYSDQLESVKDIKYQAIITDKTGMEEIMRSYPDQWKMSLIVKNKIDFYKVDNNDDVDDHYYDDYFLKKL